MSLRLTFSQVNYFRVFDKCKKSRRQFKRISTLISSHQFEKMFQKTDFLFADTKHRNGTQFERLTENSN